MEDRLLPCSLRRPQHVVAKQRLSGSISRGNGQQITIGAVMARVKQLFVDSLILREYSSPVAEALAMIPALNKMAKAGIQGKGQTD